jgi:hypothetical protein
MKKHDKEEMIIRCFEKELNAYLEEIDGKNEEYKRGFIWGKIVEMETLSQILDFPKAAIYISRRLNQILPQNR